ncbi:hypothetical protein V1517DRAFT_49307 [Lipomyces orientalis]|uniref:Uncharacterized protein n=1 Tax=Lipomyces orientalis TaxID=1233043 RepID=A0ACC3TUB0_9ASCO
MALLDKDYLLSLGQIDTELKTFLDTANLPSANYDNLDDFKAMVEHDAAAIAALGQPPLEVKQTELQYPTEKCEQSASKVISASEPTQRGLPFGRHVPWLRLLPRKS